jgi:hypothetical protein
MRGRSVNNEWKATFSGLTGRPKIRCEKEIKEY